MAVDGKLWGSFGPEIRYASLSLDGRGLSSYGHCFGRLRNLHIEHRASTLEENSFEFVEAKPSQALPLGYRSNWENRRLVAVAKCAKRIDAQTKVENFPKILMSSGTARDKDDFIEVHIYRSFDFNAFDAIGASNSVSDKRDLLTLQIIKEKAIAGGKAWLR
jgi:hypothetical protein